MSATTTPLLSDDQLATQPRDYDRRDDRRDLRGGGAPDRLPQSLSSAALVTQSIPPSESALFMFTPFYPTEEARKYAQVLVENNVHDRSDLQALPEERFQEIKQKVKEDGKKKIEEENRQQRGGERRSTTDVDLLPVNEQKLRPDVTEALDNLRAPTQQWRQPHYNPDAERKGSISMNGRKTFHYRTVFQSFAGQAHYHPHWYDKDRKKETQTLAAAIKLCHNDGQNQALLYCEACNRNLCKACSTVIHKKKEKQDHKPVTIEELRLCENDCGTPAIVRCMHCHDGSRYFCVDCDKVIHAKGNHRRLKLQPETSGLSAKERKFEETEYFFNDDLPSEAAKRIAVVVPCFNEKAEELERTLLSLANQNAELEAQMGYQLHVLLVLDGYWKASESMKQYLTQMFPEDNLSPWTARIGKIREKEETECVETFVLHAVPQEAADHSIRKLAQVDIRYTPPEDDTKEEGKNKYQALPGPGAMQSEYALAQERCYPVCTRYLYCFCVLAFTSVVGVTAFQVTRGSGGDHTTYQDIFFSALGVLMTLLVCMCCFGVLKTEPDRDRGNAAKGKKLKITLLIKRDNRRKHNSHDWFFAAFCAFYNPEFAFCTDCGTTYETGCLKHLVQHMRLHTSAVAVTGRQRVMSAKDQGSENEGWLAFFYRSAQCFDYEASLASFMGAFALVGMLPVIPGPCGLYRWEQVQDAVKFYLETVKKNPDEAGLVEGTLLLAEDRILSYAAVLKARAAPNSEISKAKTAYVPRAIFYFEAETEPLILLQQRRRWINGTMAGYLWLMGTKRDLVMDAKKSNFFKMWILFLVFCQFFLYCVVALSPGIFATGIYFGLNSGFPGDENQIPRILMFGTYLLVYVAFVARHISPGDDNKLSEWMFHLATLVNAIGVVLVITTTLYYAISDGLTPEIYLVFGIMAAPFVLALQTPSSLPYMFATVIQFYLFLPTMVAYFGAYAFSRSWELTWGNRPSDSLLSMALTVPKSEAEMKAHQKKIQENGKTIGFLIVALNLFLVLAVTVVHDAAPLFIILLSVVIFFFAAVQMGVTFFWVWLKYIPIDVFWWTFKIYIWRKCGWTVCGNQLTEVEKNVDPFEDCCHFV